MARYDFPTAGLDCYVRLDAFNVLNDHVALWVVGAAELPENGVPVVEYGEPTYFQPSRAVRLDLGLSF